MEKRISPVWLAQSLDRVRGLGSQRRQPVEVRRGAEERQTVVGEQEGGIGKKLAHQDRLGVQGRRLEKGGGGEALDGHATFLLLSPFGTAVLEPDLRRNVKRIKDARKTLIEVKKQKDKESHTCAG